jgi:hypothetical protein
MGGVGRALIVGFTALAIHAVAAPVRADGSMAVSFDVHARWFAGLPAFDSTDAPRRLPNASLRTGNPASFVGVGASWEASFGHLRLPLLGASLDHTVGRGPTVIDSLDGSIVEIDTWNTTLATLLLPGIGFRWKARRWMFEAAVQPGVSFFSTSGRIAVAGSTTDLDLKTTLFMLRGDAAICRRIDPVDRACLFFAPALYEVGAFNGGSIGLRWEMGP